MKRDNRVIFDTVTGKIVFQTGEAEGDINPHEEWNVLEYIVVPYGSIDYSKSYIDHIDEDMPLMTSQIRITDKPRGLTAIESVNKIPGINIEIYSFKKQNSE